MQIQITQEISSEVLIVGAGIGGLAACVEAHRQGLTPTLITKSVLGSGASYFPLKATLGIQVSGGISDYAKFQEDINRVAKGMNNPKIVKAYIEESAEAIELLHLIGFTPWKRNDNRPACFARYSRPIYLINEWRTAAQRARQIIEQQQTRLYENTTLLHIVTLNNQVQGAVFAQTTSGTVSLIFCKTSQIILASGGIAGLYRDNLYPADVIGSSHSIACQAGARLINLEFIQFIPSFIEPKYKVLFGEHTLKYVTRVTDSQGRDLFPHLDIQSFQAMMLERSSYAPFSVDFACVEFDLVMMKHLLENPQEKAVYLHYSPALYEDNEEFYTVYLSWLKQDVGIDLLRDKIAIAPFAHSCNGGIMIDEHAQSDVQGLFAVGEVSSCIEGANRLGGNSVGGSLVFAKRAVKRILQNLTQKLPLVTQTEAKQQAEQALNHLANLKSDNEKYDTMLSHSQLLSQIRQKMSQFANVYRTGENLAKLNTELENLESRYCPLSQANISDGIETYHALKTAQAVVAAMQQRTQSLGAHFRAD